MSDDAELAAIRNKLDRIFGKKELSPKQWKSVCALLTAHESIVNPRWREELEDFVKSL